MTAVNFQFPRRIYNTGKLKSGSAAVKEAADKAVHGVHLLVEFSRENKSRECGDAFCEAAEDINYSKGLEINCACGGGKNNSGDGKKKIFADEAYV